LQNTQYHVKRLVGAVDIWYSPMNRKMSVYALTAEELLVQFGGGDW
jgi:hypothetical protein